MKENKKSEMSDLGQTDYQTAIREFVKSTINNKDFFKLSPSEQKKEAMKYIRKHKHNEKD